MGEKGEILGRDVGRKCACPGCPNEALGGDRAYCAACEEEAHVAHCGRCGAPIFIRDRPCPACGEPYEPAKGRGG